MAADSLLSYYQHNQFNPVPIALDSDSAWQVHFSRRQNLYERHLGIPLSFLNGRSVIEFGCNSGENALVLASAGANLTLVEPNQQVWPRLKQLFRQLGLEHRIVKLSGEEIDRFETDSRFDLVVAEGFLFTLPNRDMLIRKIADLVAVGGRAIISFNDRYGMLIEATKKYLLWRVCQLAGINDVHGDGALGLAWQLYGQDYVRLNASRPFAIWYKDTLVNPFIHSDYFWSYPELITLVEEAGGQFHSSSPQWCLLDHFAWYKDVTGRDTRRRRLLDEWSRALPYFLTGLPLLAGGAEPPSDEVTSSISTHLCQISQFTEGTRPIQAMTYPAALDKYLSGCSDSRLQQFNSELRDLYEATRSHGIESVIKVYQAKEFLRSLWGVPYHYLCFTK